MTAPRQFTGEEERNLFLGHMRTIAAYWSSADSAKGGCDPSDALAVARYRCEGVIFSVLVALDGGSGGLPGYRLFPSCDPSDPAFHRAQGENWHAVNEGPGPLDAELTTVQLHEEWHR